jgi:hypothetical protein
MAVGRGCCVKGCSCGQTDRQAFEGRLSCSTIVRFPILNQRVGRAQDCSCGMVDVSRYMVVLVGFVG